MATSQITLERLEQTSALLRNTVLIIGALATGWAFVQEAFDEPVTVRMISTPIATEKVLMFSLESYKSLRKGLQTKADPQQLASELEANIGVLSETSTVLIRNNGDAPVKLEIRIPKQLRITDLTAPKDTETPRTHFMLFDVSPGCSIAESEIVKSQDQRLSPEDIGVIGVASFPPQCSLSLQMTTTNRFGFLRFADIVEVFYDGKRAPVEVDRLLHGRLATYVRNAQDRGALGIVLFFIGPFVVTIFATVLLMEAIARRKSTPSKDAGGAPGVPAQPNQPLQPTSGAGASADSKES